MAEINLMVHYPSGKGRTGERPVITEEDKRISKQFGRDYFDGDRKHGYGGFSYHPRFWTNTVKHIRDYYQLPEDCAILDVGFAKGFMLYDFMQLMPKARLAGIDISSYAIENALEAVKPLVQVGNAKSLPFPDRSFDLVISINTLHNLYCYELDAALREIERVSKKNKYMVVESYRNEDEKANLLYWQLTCESFYTPEEWQWWFSKTGYTGDHSFIYFE